MNIVFSIVWVVVKLPNYAWVVLPMETSRMPNNTDEFNVQGTNNGNYDYGLVEFAINNNTDGSNMLENSRVKSGLAGKLQVQIIGELIKTNNENSLAKHIYLREEKKLKKKP